MTPVPTVRSERPDDYEAIAEVVAAAFGAEPEARLVEAIRASPHYVADLALVAVVDGSVAGHVMISGATLRGDTGDRRIVMLSPLAVAPDLQRRGIGSALVREVTTRADDLGEPLVILEGSPTYYGRFGFEFARAIGIEINLPSWAPPEAAQVLRLRNYDPSLRGRVIYPPAFDGVTDA